MISQLTISLGFFSLTISRLPKAEVEQRLKGEKVDQASIAKASARMLYNLMTGAAYARALILLVKPLLNTRAISQSRRDQFTSATRDLSSWIKEVDEFSAHVARFASINQRTNRDADSK